MAAAFVAGSAVCALLLVRAQHAAPPAPPPLSSSEPPALLKTSPPPAQSPPPLEGIDLARVTLDDDGAVAPAASHRVAHLTLDVELQRAANRELAAHHLPEAAVVLVDVASGRVLAYASHVEHGAARDLCAEATAPAASVFKIVTSAALVEAGVSPDVRECYSGGEQKILERDLEDDPARDRWCTTLAGALGHSTNAVFAKLALRDLDPSKLEASAARFGFGEPVPFDVAVAPSTLHVPTDDLGFARTAAGFWNSTLSPVEAAWMSATVARGGDAPRLSIVTDVLDAKGAAVWTAPAPSIDHHAMSREVAASLTRMMEVTVAEGTSYRAFHDARGGAFLPGITVAGKTGTLTDAPQERFYTWFTGFAPSRAPAVAVAVLVVNKPTWKVKANVVAREMLREYFAREHTPRATKGTSAPRLESSAVARRE